MTGGWVSLTELLPGAVAIGMLTAFAAVMLRISSGKGQPSVFVIALIGVAGAYVVTPILAFLQDAWRSTPALPDLPVITSGQIFIGAWAAFAVLVFGKRAGRPPRVPLWACLFIGLVTAGLLPPLLDWLTGSYQSASLRADVDHCTRGMKGQVQPRTATNVCDEPIVVGMCLPGEINPAPCAQSYTLEPGQTAQFDPGEARLSSLPTNPGGLTVVACRPPDRPSRMKTTIGRGFEGVCLPPG